MKIKIWRVSFGRWTEVDVVAPNIKQAITNTINKRKKDDKFDIYKNSIQYVTEVTLLAEED
ncbi:MAG: hypothetical protein HZC29_04225 [Thaumarchaeota archaeon]|nr:hypothetical protein [Nitrososphaerota archaeon]